MFKNLVQKIMDDPFYQDRDLYPSKKKGKKGMKNFGRMLGIDERERKPVLQTPFQRFISCGGGL